MVEPGVFVMVTPYVTHRLAHLWKEPERFSPERFLVRGTKGEAKNGHNYYPFGVGRRSCLGQVAALTEVKTLFASIFQRSRLQSIDPATPPPEMQYAGLVVRPACGVDVVLEDR